ncbi:MAG: HAD family hydrolase [Hyphomicrobiaceae bacterium]
MAIDVVAFDVGETLIDETRLWRGYAEVLCVSERDLLCKRDEVIARGDHHHRALEFFQSDIDWAALRAISQTMDASDLYPDVGPCLAELRRRGIRIAIAGNQPIVAEAALEQMGFAAEIVASSERWGVAKPDPAFFAKLIEATGTDAEHIAYVGDRLDNDVVPALRAGLTAVLLVRGPWGRSHIKRPDAQQASLVLHDLAALPQALKRL